MVSSQHFRCTICNWDNEFVSLFVSVEYFFCVDSSKINFRLVHAFQFCVCHQTILSEFSSRFTHIQNIFRVELFFQISEVWTGLVQKSENIQPVLQKELLEHWMVHRITYQKEFSPPSRKSWTFSHIAIAFHWISRPFLIHARLQQ